MDGIRITELRNAISPELVNDKLLGEVSLVVNTDGGDYDVEIEQYVVQGGELTLYADMGDTVEQVANSIVSDRDAHRDEVIRQIQWLIQKWKEQGKPAEKCMQEIESLVDEMSE